MYKYFYNNYFLISIYILLLEIDMSQKYGQNFKCKIFPLESAQNGLDYSCTINPDDNWQYWDSPNRLRRFKDAISNKLLLYEKVFTFSGYYEMSSVGRLHLHGVIQFHNCFDFYLFTIHHMLRWCVFEIDTINDHGLWTSYITKQHSQWTTSNKVSDFRYPVKADRRFARPRKSSIKQYLFLNDEELMSPEKDNI